MSRRKQAKPQQVESNSPKDQLPNHQASLPALIPEKANKLGTFDSSQVNDTSQTRAKQTRIDLLEEESQSIVLHRETEQTQAGNFAFFPATTLEKPSMSMQTSSFLAVPVSDSLKTQKIMEENFQVLEKVEENNEENIKEKASILQDCEESVPQEVFSEESSVNLSLQDKSQIGVVQSASADSKFSTGGMTVNEMSRDKTMSEKQFSTSDLPRQPSDFSQKNTNEGEEVFHDEKPENASFENSEHSPLTKQISAAGQINLDDPIHSSPESEKENLTAANVMAMLNKSQDLSSLEKSQDELPEEGKELKKIKDQVRLLQQQQMYQVQMLHYLQFQLNMMASHPQSQQKSSSGTFPPGGLNGLQLQNMPQLLAAAASMSESGLQGSHTPTNSFFPTMAAAINQQLSSNKLGDNPQQVFGCSQDEMNKPFNLAKLRNDNENVSQNSSTGKGDAYNPLSSLAMLQNPSQVRSSVSDILTNHSRDNIDNDDNYLKHVCRYCQKAFGSDSALQIHLRSHTGERPYKCNICANRFSTKGNLKVHFVRHKERYPLIEMNPNPVPEYLDNIPTSSGIPYGMSVVPDVLDNNDNEEDISSSAGSKRTVELPAPYNCLDSGKTYPDQLPKANQDPNSKTKTDFSERSPNIPNIFEGDLGTKQNQGRRFPPLLLPFANMMANGDCQETPVSIAIKSDSPAISDKAPRNASSDLSNESADPSLMPLISNTSSSSETSKLQQLVEQIDRGKELEKNECHICHRVLSCQSALKLHYRTHTGERPYKCDLCSRAFTTRGNLRTHYSSVHRQQLQNITADMGARANALQCPLCGSRFMDQQSFQQHMQMHIYMHNQQQQQALQLMNGQGGVPPEYRMLSVVNGGFPANLVMDRQFSQNEAENEQNCNENDDVFEDNPHDKKDSFKPTKTFSPVTADTSSNAMICNLPTKNQTIQSEMKNSSVSYPNNASNTEADEKQSEGPSEGVLDLSRPSSNSSSSNGDPKSSSSPQQDNCTSVSPQVPTTTSLNMLASIAANDAAMRLNGLSSMNLPMSAAMKEEMRARKMTTACEICNKPFTCQSALEIHLRSHTKERPFVCRVCERGFTTKGNLKQHLLTHNITDVDEDMLEPVASPINGNSNSISPPLTSTTQTSSYNQLKRHRDTSPSIPPPAAKRTYPRHWCHICQKQFSSASSLQIHNRTHTGEKPFACSVCGRAFTTKGNLKVHMGTHVWGAGGSRRGRRISMDNPLISPWMQNTTNTNSTTAPLRQRVPPQIPAVPDQTAIYQQYAALASGLMGAKAAAAGGDPRFHNNAVMNLNSAAAKLLMSNNISNSNSGTAPPDDKSMELSGKDEPNKSMAEIATEWIWNAYKKSQEQDVN